jgi:hypothetical protein
MTLLQIIIYTSLFGIACFLTKNILISYTNSFYEIPKNIHKQYFWIETHTKNNQTYHEIHYRKILGDKFINITHKDVFESIDDAFAKSIELSKNHCSHSKVNVFMVKYGDCVTSIVFQTH